MAAESRDQGGLLSQLPVDRLRDEAQNLGRALSDKGLSAASGRVTSLTDSLTGFADSGGVAAKAAKRVAEGDNPAKATAKAGASELKDKVKDRAKEALGMNGSGGDKVKVTNIVEEIDVPVPRSVAYEKWTQLEEFPSFMKKVENVDQEEDNQVRFKAQVFWSHRSWDATIIEQVPDERIIWKSQGEKGSVDGAVTFHELAPDLTRILLVLEYHPQGLFERTGNLWRAQGRRARLELKHFRRDLTTQTLLHTDELEGWRGEIRDEETVKTDQQKRKQEREASRSRSSGQGTTRKSQPAKKSTAKKSTGKKSQPAKKSTAKKSTAKKSTAKKSTAKKSQPAKRSTAKKSTARKRTRSSS
ncbi:MAG: SRPBCC family protein [Nocardioidaceae bacterium]